MLSIFLSINSRAASSVDLFGLNQYCRDENSSFDVVVVVVVDPLLPDYWGESASVVLWGFAASFSRQSPSRAATPGDPSTNPGPIAWWVSVGNRRDVVWYVRECDKGGRVVMGVLRRRFCVDMIGGKGIYLFLVGPGYDVLLTCGGCVRSILLLSLAARC